MCASVPPAGSASCAGGRHGEDELVGVFVAERFLDLPIALHLDAQQRERLLRSLATASASASSPRR
jgi:hypothetical protein